MSRYIDVNEFYDKMYEWVRMHGGIIRNEMQAILEAVPSIDIVRCSECNYRNRCSTMIVFGEPEHITEAFPIEYCSWGEREK